MKITNRFLLSLICMIVALYLPMLQVRAEDNTADQEGPFTYSLEASWTYYEDRPNNVALLASRNAVYSFSSTYPLAGYMADNSQGHYGVYILSSDGGYFDYVYTAPLYYDGVLYVDSNGTGPNKLILVGTNLQSNQRDCNFSLTSSDIPIFSTKSEMEHYFETGDDSGCINKDPDYDSNKLHFSSSLGYLQGVQYKNVTPTDVFPYQIYSQISWDNSNDDFKDAYVQFAADMTYKVGARIYSESMSIFNSYSIPYSDGKYTFLMSEVLNGSVVGSNATIKKVDFYYVRLVKYDRENSVFLYGGWTRIDTNKFTVDTIAFDAENQDYYIDSDSDSSYSDQMGIDGNYGTTTWGDLSSASADSFKWFFSMLKDLFGMMGSFPSMLKTVFSFLPSAYINCLSLLLMACIIMRILGR